MKLFSKRNKKGESRLEFYRPRAISSGESSFYRERQKRISELVSPNVRTRLVSLIKFLTSSDTFLEKYILIDNRKDKIHYLNKRLIDDFSESELGYKFSIFFTFYPFNFSGKLISENEEKEELLYDDYILFDLLETVILFSKKTQRKDVIQKIKKILEEEKTGFSIKESIITRDSGEDLKSISLQLKDQKLSLKINSYYSFIREGDFLNASKISSEILSIVISDEVQDKKKTMKNTWKKISKSIVNNSKKEDLEKILNEVSKICNLINNSISDIRHSEEDRIKVSNEYIYKMSCYYNISLVEVILTSLKDDFISTDDWEEIKNKYIENYKINKDTIYYIPDPKSKPDNVESDIDPEDIPF